MCFLNGRIKMKVSALIELLKKCEQNKEVKIPDVFNSSFSSYGQSIETKEVDEIDECEDFVFIR